MTEYSAPPGAASTGGQQDVDSAVLRMAAARFFTQRLRVPVVPDWGVQPNGTCTCEKALACLHPGKHPSVRNWRDRATFDLDQIARWIRAGRNLAVVPYSYIVVDIEVKAGKDGLTPFRRWCALAGLDIETVLSTFTVRSGGGGLHLWYWLDEETVRQPPKGMDGWLPDVDIKTSRNRNGKATIPGSRHASGRVYEFELNAVGGTGFQTPRRAPHVLVDEVAAGRAWRLLPESEWPSAGSGSGGAVRFGDVVDAALLWRRAEILAPGAERPPKSAFAGMALGSLTDGQQEWARSVTP